MKTIAFIFLFILAIVGATVLGIYISKRTYRDMHLDVCQMRVLALEKRIEELEKDEQMPSESKTTENVSNQYEIGQSLTKLWDGNYFFVTTVLQNYPTKDFPVYNIVISGHDKDERDPNVKSLWQTRVINDSVKRAQYGLAERWIKKQRQ